MHERDEMFEWDNPRDLEPMQQLGAQVIGDNLFRGRLRLGLSQRQLVWQVGLAQSTISRLENGKLRGVTFKNLATIIGVLSKGPDFRLADEPPKPMRRLPGQGPDEAMVPKYALAPRIPAARIIQK